MNQQQQKVYDAFNKVKSSVEMLLEQPTQEEFVSQLGKISMAVQEMMRLEGRGVEQWIYNLKLTNQEYKDLIDKLKESK